MWQRHGGSGSVAWRVQHSGAGPLRRMAKRDAPAHRYFLNRILTGHAWMILPWPPDNENMMSYEQNV